MPRVYVPHDDGIRVSFGAHDFELEGNEVVDLDKLAKTAKREDITGGGLLTYVLQVYGPQGVREVPEDGKARKGLVEKAEEAHGAWLATSLGAVLARHRKLQEEDKAKGLKPRPDTDEVTAARKTLKAWGLI